MKLTLLSCLVCVLPCLVLSNNPQITQSCSGSHCGQNNVARRKREIVAEILVEAVEAVGREERSAPPPPPSHAHDGSHHQVQVPPVHVPHIHIPPVHIPDIHIPDVHVPDVHVPHVHVPVP